MSSSAPAPDAGDTGCECLSLLPAGTSRRVIVSRKALRMQSKGRERRAVLYGKMPAIKWKKGVTDFRSRPFAATRATTGANKQRP